MHRREDRKNNIKNREKIEKIEKIRCQDSRCQDVKIGHVNHVKSTINKSSIMWGYIERYNDMMNNILIIISFFLFGSFSFFRPFAF